MSLKMMAACWELDMPREQKLILLGFADHANDEGFAWPSLARIAWKCGYQQRRTVRDIVRKLLESGVLQKVEDAHGRTPVCYRIRPHFGSALPPFDPAMYKKVGGAENAPPTENATDKTLDEQEKSGASEKGGAVSASPEAQGVRSARVGGAVSARSGGGQRTPNHLTIEPRAPARPNASGSGAGAQDEDGRLDRELFLLNNSARLLGTSPKTKSESMDDFRKRLHEAHMRKLEAMAENQRKTKQADAGDETDAESKAAANA